MTYCTDRNKNIIHELASIVGDYNVQVDELEGKVNELQGCKSLL